MQKNRKIRFIAMSLSRTNLAKNGYYRQSCRLPDSSIRGVVFRIRISPRIRSQNQNSSKCSVRDLGQSDLCRQTDRQTDRQADRRTDRQTERQTSKYLPVLYCSFLLYSKYSTYVVLNALYYILGGGDLRGTLGPKSRYFCS